MDASDQTNLHVLTSQWSTTEGWNYPDLRAPYWRLYWNERPGAHIVQAGRRIELAPHRFLLIPAETPFASHSRRTVRHFYVHFLISRHWSRSGVTVLPANETERDTILELVEMGPAAGWRLISFLAGLLGRLPEKGWRPSSDPGSRIRASLEKIDARAPTLVPVPELARDAAMNPNAFARLFRERIGISPARYARERRIEMACLFLHHSDRSIDDIAATCGFCDRYHLTHAFTRSRGISPAAFRRQIAG